jgi:hypothetical protein
MRSSTPNEEDAAYVDTKKSNKRDIPTNIHNFLWKAIHNGHKIGEYWKKIQNYEHRGVCPKCKKTEDLNHILFKCTHNQNQTIWGIIREVCTRKKIEWPSNMNISHIMATPLWSLKDKNGLPKKGNPEP